MTEHFTPIRIFLSPPDVGEDERKLPVDASYSNWIAALGPHVDAFEQEVAAYLGGTCTAWRSPAARRHSISPWSTSASDPATRP